MKQPGHQPEPTTAQVPVRRIYRLKITLRYTDPPIWRRVEVPAEIKIDSLASVMLILFGWDGEHLSEFDIKGQKYSAESNWELEQPMWEIAHHFERLLQARSLPPKERAQALIEAARLKPRQPEPTGVPALSDLVARARTKFTFTYDFGDDWKHFIEVETIAPADPNLQYPRCTDGARGHPLEDCGGHWGLAELIATAGNPKHSRFESLQELGLEKWDPAAFPLEDINQRLTKCLSTGT